VYLKLVLLKFGQDRVSSSMWHLEANNLLSEAQYGCRRSRSSTMTLAQLDAHIQSANTNQAKLYSVFFDLQNAFPRVWRHLILTRLYKYDLRGQLPRLLQNYLTDRFFRIRVGGHLSSVHTQDNGIPQGSPFSGILFLVAINDILSAIPYPVKPLLFVDNLSIHMQSPDIHTGFFRASLDSSRNGYLVVTIVFISQKLK